MSPEEWAFKISELIREAEAEGMRFFVSDGDFLITIDSDDSWDELSGVMIW